MAVLGSVASGVEYIVFTVIDPVFEVWMYNWATGSSQLLANDGYTSLDDVTLDFESEAVYFLDDNKVYQIDSATSSSPVVTMIHEFDSLEFQPKRLDALTGTTPNVITVMGNHPFGSLEDPALAQVKSLTFSDDIWNIADVVSYSNKTSVDVAVTRDGIVWSLVEDDTQPYLYRFDGDESVSVEVTSTPNSSGANPRRISAKADSSLYVAFNLHDYESHGG